MIKVVNAGPGLLMLLVLGSCAITPARQCPSGTQDLPDCPPLNAIQDDFIDELYEYRAWVPPEELTLDPIELGKRAEIPIQSALTKLLGPTSEGGLNSLAAKLWMIENAEHTIDAIYYIFKRDLVGQAVLGALCEAVQRGVDVRLIVDSTGSIHADHLELKGLASCAKNAGFMRNADGQLTTRKARAQVLIFNALSNIIGPLNRRSHDKLLIKDGMFPDKAFAMTGGRNISLSYYGFAEDGSPNPDTYLDAEILLRPGDDQQDPTVTEVSDVYYSILFFFEHNRLLETLSSSRAQDLYTMQRRKARNGLRTLRRLPLVRQHLDDMDRFMHEGFNDSTVRLAHELANLTNTNVVTNALANMQSNPNSIMFLLDLYGGIDVSVARYVSPYLFVAEYFDKDGNLILDEAKEIHDWLEENPNSRLEIITNSVLSSDNVPAQAIIDMDTAPRLFLTDELRASWLATDETSPEMKALASSREWQALINHPRLSMYQTGKLDAVLLGGDVHYGKLHAKFIVEDDSGFIGTSNFDYRSRLYNNEMGFFFEDEALARELNEWFDMLKSSSYRWGTPEWLELRRQVAATGGLKGIATANQRPLFKTLRAMGMDWLF